MAQFQIVVGCFAQVIREAHRMVVNICSDVIKLLLFPDYILLQRTCILPYVGKHLTLRGGSDFEGVGGI